MEAAGVIPWMQNCPHISEGWCVECVSRLGRAIEDYFENDGSRGRFSALMLYDARMRVNAALCNTTPETTCGLPEQVTPLIDRLIPTRFVVPNPAAEERDAVRIERRSGRGGKELWAVCQWDNVLGKDGQWECEPFPSSRTDEFLSRCRFDSLQEACEAIEKFVK